MAKTHQILLGSETVLRAAPVALADADRPLFSHELKKQLPPTSYRELQPTHVYSNGYLATPFSLFPDAASFSGNQCGPAAAIKNAAKLALQRLGTRKTVSIAAPAFFPCDENSNGFFHWLGDVLPRIELFVAMFGMEELRKHVLIVPGMASFSYVLPSLLPYDLEHIQIVNPGQRVRVSLLGAMTPVAPTGNFRPAIVQALRARYRAFFGAASGAPSAAPDSAKLCRKLFISRAKAPRRHIAHEEALWPVLDSYGFERIFIEDMDFSEQVRYILRAEVLVGLHGAGLTNMLWMAPGSKILEIRFAGDSLNNCYFSLASALGLPYYYLLAEKENPGDSAQDANAIVNPAALHQVLTALSKGSGL